MTTIDVKIKFGNNNSFDMKLSINTSSLYIYSSFLEITRVKEDYIKYMICNGKILDKNTTLRDLKIIDKKLLVHFIVSNELKGSYPMDEILQNEYKLYYGILKESAIAKHTIGSYQQNLNNFTDVVVTLTHSQFDSLTSSVTLDAEDINDDNIDEVTCFCFCGDDNNIELTRTRTWLPCSHSFHTSCIKRYLTTTSVMCPTCGIDVRDEHT